MGFQPDTGAVVVKATLTDLGTKYLLTEPNKFVIDKFAVYDDEVDYRLWNPDHPNGTDYYGYAIENLPLLEPITTAAYQLKYALHRDYERDTARLGVGEILGDGKTNVVLESIRDVHDLAIRYHNVTPENVEVTVGNKTVATVSPKSGNIVEKDIRGTAIANTTRAAGFIQPRRFQTGPSGDVVEFQITPELNPNVHDPVTTMVTIRETSHNVINHILVTVQPNGNLNLAPTTPSGK
tara:strand:- start:877 stop:1587 length:711 start_codon:yes stop_codon:yes gene_type:complete